MTTDTEEWRSIPDPDFSMYSVSNFGNVYNTKKQKPATVLRNRKTGYFYVSLYSYREKKSFCKYVHRLVAMAFIPNKDNKPYVDHIDTDKSNNTVENLRWVTAKENVNNELTIKHMIKNHADVFGENNSFYGKKHSDESKKAMSEKKSGKNNPCYGRIGEKHPMFGKPSATKGKKRYFNEETQKYYYA